MSVHETIQFDPVFMDILSGKFQPETDSEGRIHQLNRLVVGTANKGQLNIISHNIRDYLYTPSWGGGSTSKIEVAGDVFKHIELRRSEASLWVGQLVVREIKVARVKYGNYNVQEAPLELGDDDFNHLQLQIAEQAADLYRKHIQTDKLRPSMHILPWEQT